MKHTLLVRALIYGTEYRGTRPKKITSESQKHIADIIQQTPLGKGEFGATYDYDKNQVIKVITVLNKQHKDSIFFRQY